MLYSLGCVAIYVLLVGIAAFLQKLVSASLDAFQLNLSVRAGTLLLAVPAAAIVHGVTVPSLVSALSGMGIGALAGLGVLFYDHPAYTESARG